MMVGRRQALHAAATLWFIGALAACGDSDTTDAAVGLDATPAATDASARRDATLAADAAANPDAAANADAAANPDGAASADAAANPDGAASADAAANPDGAANADGAANPDATSGPDAADADAGVSADSGTSADTGAGDTGGAVQSFAISAATGGTITVTGLEIVIPAGALAQDTTVTVQELAAAGLPATSSIASRVYDLGPDGLQFSQPVTLTFDRGGAQRPAGATAAIAYLDAGAWLRLGDSAESGNQVTATTTHFTPFAVIWVAGGPAGGCAHVGFAGCGGDLTGLWNASLECAVFPPPPVNPSCPAMRVEATFEQEGTVDFMASGRYLTVLSSTITSVVYIPKTCLPPGRACSDIDPIYTDTGTVCVASQSQTSSASDSGTWSTSGSVLTRVEDDDGSVHMEEYCVTGSSALVRSYDPAEEEESIFRLTR